MLEIFIGKRWRVLIRNPRRLIFGHGRVSRASDEHEFGDFTTRIGDRREIMPEKIPAAAGFCLSTESLEVRPKSTSNLLNLQEWFDAS